MVSFNTINTYNPSSSFVLVVVPLSRFDDCVVCNQFHTEVKHCSVVR